MNIAIATDWFAPRPGGIESQLETLATQLAGRGHQVTVITSTPGTTHGTGYAIRRIPGARLPVAGVAISPALGRTLRSAIGDHFDVVHAHVSVVSPVGYLAALAGASQGVPTILTFHSVLRLKRMLLSAVNAAVHLAERPVAWTAVSQLVAQQVRRSLGGVNVAVLPNGIDLPYWREPPRGVTSEAGGVTFVTAMRLHRKKRPRELVAAFARAVARARTPARLVLAGDGPELPALRRDIARLRPAAVELVGWQDRSSLRALYARADAFVLPTRHEAFGIAALEARAAGLPVIASRHAGCREFLRDDHNALLCESDGDFAVAMERFLHEPQLRDRLAAGETALERYDWRTVLAEHERLYDLATTGTSRVFAPAPATA